MSVFDFWEMTFGEVIDTIEAYNNNKLEEMKYSAMMAYQTGRLVAIGVGNAFGGGEFPQIHDIFPGLFDKPELKQQDGELMKARLMSYAEAWKSKNK